MNDSDSPDMGATLVSESYCPHCDASYPTGVERCPTDGTALVELGEETDSLIGLEIDGRFTIKRRLGKGGMGTAFAATQHSIGREVAIKVVHPHLARDRMGAKRFLRETKLAAQLSHPNTVTVIDFGQTSSDSPGGRRLYMAMELVDGDTLAQVLRKGRMPIERAINIATQICAALEAAHRLSIVHRDLKPSNVMLEKSSGRDHVKVLDFGLAKSLTGEDTTVTESNVIVGTPQYISPELVTGSKADHRSDLYSLGAVLYEMAAGRPPFSADSVQACLFAQVHDAPPPLPADVPSGLADIILQLLAKRPELRFQTATELAAALDEFRSTGSSTAIRRDVVVATPTVESKPERRGRGIALVIALSLLVVGAAGAFIALGAGGGEPEGSAANEAATSDSTATSAENTEGVAIAMDASPPEQQSDAGAQFVLLSVNSSPPAAVASAGESRCNTPCSLRVARSEVPLEVRFTRRGYVTKTATIVPRAAATVAVDLAKKRSGRSGSARTGGSGKTAGSGSGSDGFVDAYND